MLSYLPQIEWRSVFYAKIIIFAFFGVFFQKFY